MISRCSPSAAPARCTPPRWLAELGVPKVLMPSRPGITNAIGCVVADLRHDFVNTLNRPLDAVDEAELHRVFADQIERG